MNDKPKLNYGWINVGLAFFCMSTYGLFYSYSVFIEPLERELHTTRAVISAVYTLELAVYCGFSIFWGWFSDAHGPRKSLWVASVFLGAGVALCSLATSVWHLYLFFGVIAGIGHGAIWIAPIANLNRWFREKRGLAMGMALCGLGFGLLVVPPLTALIMKAYGWRVTFLILGLAFFTLNVLTGLFIRGNPGDTPSSPSGQTRITSRPAKATISTRDFSTGEALRTMNFWLIYGGFLFTFAAEQMLVVHIVPYGTSMGIATTQGALALSFFGVGTMIGRAGIGALSDKLGRIPSLLMSSGIETVTIFFLLAVKGPLSLYLLTLAFGTVYGGMAVLCSALLADLFGLKNIGMIMGVWGTTGVLAGLIGPLMAGVVFDLTRSYFWAIIIAGTICAGAIVLIALIRPYREQLRPELARNGESVS